MTVVGEEGEGGGGGGGGRWMLIYTLLTKFTGHVGVQIQGVGA